MNMFTPLPRSLTRPVSALIVIAWAVSMAVLVNRSYLQTSAASLATDLARYGSNAEWRGVYYRGDKIGFTVSQIVPTEGGFELQEDGRLQMSLLGASTAAALHTSARVDSTFGLRSFDFSLNPGTGAVVVRGRVEPMAGAGRRARLVIAITSAGHTRTETRELDEVPVLSQNFSRLLASGRLAAGSQQQWTIFDPATLRNQPVTVKIGDREIVRNIGERPIPAFRVDMAYQGLRTTSWITDTGDVVREESPLGLITVRESADRAQTLSVPGRLQTDLLQAAAVVPAMRQRIDEPRDVRRLRVELDGADLTNADLQGAGQTVKGSTIELTDPQTLQAGPADDQAGEYLKPEAFIESDAPEIRAEAEKAVAGAAGTRARAEKLTRYVNALLDKKPTVSLPSAREVLRTKVGDCNEHTALYVAMARSIGIPARIAVGLTYVRGITGAFYYHAWPEVYIDEGSGRGLWLPVDPTLNEFPADATHLRLARGGLDKQAAILPMIGRIKMKVLDMTLDENATPILIGQSTDLSPMRVVSATPQTGADCCWLSRWLRPRRPSTSLGTSR
ncbi:MAG TPA: transglutaminase domain-containing protein [Vicinamibacterales bacterium]|jgi:transglutaminase-like putative cysteine protease